MTSAENTWKWIQQVELRFGIDKIPIPDRYCENLISRLEYIVPLLQAKHLPKYDGMFTEDFIPNFASKLWREPTNRSMLFDFIKDLIHVNLLDTFINAMEEK